MSETAAEIKHPVPWEPDPSEGEKLTDTGNAMRLRRLHGRDLRYVSAKGKWYVWSDDGLWREDDTGEALRRAIRTVKDGLREASEEADKEIREARVKHFLKSENEPQLRRMLAVAQSLRGIALTMADFDRDPYLLNCANGSLNLKTGELQPHSRADLCTRQSPIRFVLDAPCPRWERFLEEVFLGDRGLICFVRRALGYAMTGDTREQAAFFALGVGANGKSVLLETIRHVLGTYAVSCDASTFLEREADGGPRNDLARLAGARFVTAVEPEEGSRLAEGFVKAVTGGDVVTARYLFREFFEFRPQFKLWLGTNHRPQVRGTDEGIWRRIRLLPFLAIFLGDKQDQTVPAQLRAEAEGILSWLVHACLEWQEQGLGTAEAVVEATKAYRSEQDVLGQFLAERCELGSGEFYAIASGALYKAYKAWCEQHGERHWSQRAVGRHLADRGFKQARTKRARSWEGIRLADEDAELPLG